MVCQRCLAAITHLLQQDGYTIVDLALGEATISEDLNVDQLNRLNDQLKHLGFELIDNHKSSIVNQIKSLIIQLVHHQQEPIHINLSDYLTQHLPYEYNYLSNLFSDQENTTIEKYYITQKTEKVKELLTYDELTLSQIAYRLGYSSVAHLSNQFKKVTGLTPSHFKQVKAHKRRNIEEL